MNTLASLALFAQQNKADDGGLGAFACIGTCLLPFLIVGGIVTLVAVLIMWKVFTKAGQPGWAALVPIYNTYVFVVEIAKKDMTWFLLSLFVPFAVVVPMMDVAEKFGKDRSFGIGMLLLPPVFFGILAFGSAEYQGRKSGGKKKSRSDDEDDENW